MKITRKLSSDLTMCWLVCSSCFSWEFTFTYVSAPSQLGSFQDFSLSFPSILSPGRGKTARAKMAERLISWFVSLCALDLSSGPVINTCFVAETWQTLLSPGPDS